MADYNEKSLNMHETNQGKVRVESKVKLRTAEDLSTAYTPGVAQPCRQIAARPEDVYKYTMKGRMVAVISNGSAVLGLGNIGPEAGLPVMEGKCVLFREFAGVEAFPLVIDAKTAEEMISVIRSVAPTFGGINLEDIKAPECFEVEQKLQELLDIPVFHDDQHGTAVVVLAALKNALKVVGKDLSQIRIVVNGTGAAGTAIIKMLLLAGAQDVLAVDSQGILSRDRAVSAPYKEELIEKTNPKQITGTLEDAVAGADVFIGVSKGGILTPEMVKTMNKDAVIFAMANPTPEIMPELAREAGAKIVASGRSDYPNQINNVLCFPGLFKGALQIRAGKITGEMELAAAEAIASLVEDSLSEEFIVPSPLDERVAPAVAEAVARAGRECGVART